MIFSSAQPAPMPGNTDVRYHISRFNQNLLQGDTGETGSGKEKQNIFKVGLIAIFHGILRMESKTLLAAIPPVFLFGLILGQNRAPFPMPKSIFYSKLLTNNSQCKNCENFTEENHYAVF